MRLFICLDALHRCVHLCDLLAEKLELPFQVIQDCGFDRISTHRDGESARDHVSRALRRLEYPDRKDAPGLAGVLLTAGRVELEAGAWRRAEQFASDAFAAASKSARDPALSADVGQALLLRGRARHALEDRSGAVADFSAALVSLSNALGSDHPDTQAARMLRRAGSGVSGV